MHTLLDLRSNIPSFIHISDGKMADVHALDMLVPEAGAIYVMDRGYIDFRRLYGLHQAGAVFVTRAKSNLHAHRVYSASTDRTSGVIADQTIALDGARTRQDYPERLRRIRFKDPETGKTLVFLTNQTSLPAPTICDLYKSRWKVDIDQAWCLSRLKGCVVGLDGGRRQSAPRWRCRPDDLQVGDRVRVGGDELCRPATGFDQAAA
jgi:hypothetical protein